MSLIETLDFRRVLWLFLLLQSHYQFSFCEDNRWGCDGRLGPEKSIHVLNGRNVSVMLPPLQTTLQSTQSLVWIKGESTWEKRHNSTLQFTGGNVSFDVTRYNLIEDTNSTLTLIISFIEINDTGKHVISIYDGALQICTVFILNLTVESTEPNCFTIFDKKRNKIQMTCQWVQVIEGGQAHLVDEENRVIYAHESFNMNFEGRFNLTNKFSVYIDPRDIFDGRTLPVKCVISHPKRNEEKTCKFPPVERYTIEDAKTENVTFQCCIANKNFYFTWWYKTDGDFTSLHFMEEVVILTSERILFVCAEGRNDSNPLLIYDVGSLDFGNHIYTTSVSDRNPITNSTDNKSCQTLHVNVIRNTSKSTISEDRNPTQVTSSNLMPTDLTTNKSQNTSTSLIVPLTVVSAIAFSLTICMCFVIIRGFYRHRVKPSRHFGMISSTATGGDATESLELTNISSAQFRPRNDVPTNTLAREQYRTGNAIMRSCQEMQSGLSNFSFQGDSEAVDNKCITYTKNKYEGKDLSFEQTMREIGWDSTGSQGNIQIEGAQPTVVVPSAPFQDSTYCSLDDVKATPSNARIASPMSFRSLPHSSDGQSDHSDPYNAIMHIKRPYTVEQKDGRQKSSAKRSGPTRNVDELYAKPDMSRKTKKIAAVESDYDDPRVPGDDFYPSASHSVLNHSHIYSNSVATTPDEINCDSTLLMNESGHSSF